MELRLEAKTHLSRLLNRVAAGEEIVIARAGKPIARLTAFHAPVEERVLGRDAGAFEVPEDFDAPLPVAMHHALRVATLPQHHRDPFDRLLIAQAQLEELTLFTADAVFAAYDVDLIRVA